MLEASKLDVLIVDDEPLARQLLEEIVEEIPCVARVETCTDGVEAIDAIRARAPDLVLLDIRMPEVDGFDVIRAVGSASMPEVVFVTGHGEYSLQAFEFHALDYVLKPFSPSRIRDAVVRAAHRVAAEERHTFSNRLVALVEQLDQAKQPKEYASRLTVRDGERFKFTDVAAIDWLEASGNYVRLHIGKESYAVRSTLRALLARLDPARFVRIHRSAAVNIERVKEVQPWFGGDHLVILLTGEQLRASRTYRTELLALLH